MEIVHLREYLAGWSFFLPCEAREPVAKSQVASYNDAEVQPFCPEGV
jgi:hypothetical protein